MNQFDPYKFKRQYRCFNHPIQQLPESIRCIYLNGLGALLYMASNNDGYVHFIFEQWEWSILESVINYWKSAVDAIKKSLELRQVGFEENYIQKIFFFDCFCLLSHDNGYANRAKVIIEQDFMDNSLINPYRLVLEYFDQKRFICSGISPVLTSFEQYNRSIDSETKSILVVGNVNAGKSMLINAIVGRRINQSNISSCTNSINCLFNKRVEDGIVYMCSDSDSIHYIAKSEKARYITFNYAGVNFHSLLKNENICIYDTPGANDVKCKEHRIMTYNAISELQYDLLLHVADATNHGTTDEMVLLEQIRQRCKKPVIFVINKFDQYKREDDSIKKTVEKYYDQLNNMGFINPLIAPMSSYAALLLKLEKSELSEEDVEDLDSVRDKFSQHFYSLSDYIGRVNSTQLIDKTGITYLEKLINKTLNI